MAKKLKIQSSFQRFEKKYLLTQAQYGLLLDGMSRYLRPDDYGRYTICNIYYDTDNYQLIRASLEKPVYKEKLRVTFDTNLRWRKSELDLRCGDYGELLLPKEQILMEIKIPGAAPVWLSHLLSCAGAFPTSFSKYGTCYRQKLIGTETDHFAKEESCCA